MNEDDDGPARGGGRRMGGKEHARFGGDARREPISLCDKVLDPEDRLN
jgi:hypothetical protein